MAIHIKCKNTANDLYESIFELAEEQGGIDTWIMDNEGDFTHTPPQWREKAWLRRSESSEEYELIFGIIGRKDMKMSKTIYAVYHGRFVEMLLTHFDMEIEEIKVSSLLENGIDLVP